jgi:hypothetical protein
VRFILFAVAAINSLGVRYATASPPGVRQGFALPSAPLVIWAMPVVRPMAYLGRSPNLGQSPT